MKELFEEKFKKQRELVINNFIVKHGLDKKKINKEQRSLLRAEVQKAYMALYQKHILKPMTRAK